MHASITSCTTFCSYHFLTSSLIYYWTCMAPWNLLILSLMIQGCPLLGFFNESSGPQWPPSVVGQNKFCFQTILFFVQVFLIAINPSNDPHLKTHQHSPVSSWQGTYSLCTLNILNQKRDYLTVDESCLILSFSSCQCYLPSNLHLLKFKVSTKLCARVEILCHVLKRNMVNKGFKCKQMNGLKRMVTLLIWIQCHLRDVCLRSGVHLSSQTWNWCAPIRNWSCSSSNKMQCKKWYRVSNHIYTVHTGYKQTYSL